MGNENINFGWPEYLVFGAMLAISASIGVIFAWIGAKKMTTNEFLMAGREMSVFPVAMSLLASFISAITMLGNPAEIYQYGTQYWVIAFAMIAVILSTSTLYMPVFFDLKLTSAYEYLEMRFCKPMRIMGSCIFTLQMCLQMAIAIYAPSLALSQVTGIDVIIACVILFVVCVFYTSIGGMKAVIYTDVFQIFLMFTSLIMVIVKGSIDLGGGGAVWQIGVEGDRIHFFDVNPDPRVRHSLWGLLIGGYFTWLTLYGTNQAEVQRCLTVPTKAKAFKALWVNCVGLVSIVCICSYAGLVMYAKYADCHPLYTGRIKRGDQLLPLFVMDTFGEYPGLPGLFVAGIYSGALSTVSSGLNSLATVILQDIVRDTFFPNISERNANIVSKLLTVLFGVICFALVFVIKNVGGVLQAAYSVVGMIGGPLLGTFTLGLFFPWAEKRGAIFGTIVSLTFLLWLGISSTYVTVKGDIVHPKLHFNTSGCSPNDTITISPMKPGKHGGIYEVYRISYIWYPFLACWITVTFGLLFSCLTSDIRKNARELNPALISKPIDKLINFLFPGKLKKIIAWEIGADYIEKDQKERNGDMKMS